MTRAIGIAFLGSVSGLLLGLLFAGSEGGAIGVLIGCALALLWLAAVPGRPRVPAGAAPERTHGELLCVPRGRVADCTLVRDKKSGTWLDVESCSLQGDAVRCAKRCLILLNDCARA